MNTQNGSFDPAYLRRLGMDPLFFLHEVWTARGADSYAPIGPLETHVVRFLATGPRFRGVLGFRGFGKTNLSMVVPILWRAYRDPSRRFIIVSKSEGHAKKTVQGLRELIRSVPFLRHLQPRGGQRDAATFFDLGPGRHDRQPSISAFGVSGQLEGNRAHSLIPDDIETKRNTMTFESRSELRRLIAEFPNILYPNRPHDQGGSLDPTEIVYLGTPKHEETVYLDLAKTGIFDFRGYPIAYPSPAENTICFAPELKADLDAGRAKPGEPTCPHRFPATEIASRRAANLIVKDEDGEPIDFAMENMLIAKVTGEAAHPFKLRDFIVAPFKLDRDKAPLSITWGTQKSGGESTRAPIPTDALGEDCFLYPVFYDQINQSSYTGTRARVDPAGTGKDKVGLAIAGHLSGFIWVKCVAGLEGGGSPETMIQIAHALRQHGATLCTVEPNFGGDSFANLLQVFCNQLTLRPGQDPLFPDGWACSVELSKTSSGQKELRMIGHLKPALDAHRVVLDPAVAADIDLQRQITRLTKSRESLKHDDKLEVLAAVVHDWFDQLRLDPVAAASTARQRQLDEQLERDRRTLMPFLDKPRRKAWHEVG